MKPQILNHYQRQVFEEKFDAQREISILRAQIASIVSEQKQINEIIEPHLHRLNVLAERINNINTRIEELKKLI
jgi:peptidoglycan hydrolase CwlO-like protein